MLKKCFNAVLILASHCFVFIVLDIFQISFMETIYCIFLCGIRQVQAVKPYSRNFTENDTQVNASSTLEIGKLWGSN